MVRLVADVGVFGPAARLAQAEVAGQRRGLPERGVARGRDLRHRLVVDRDAELVGHGGKSPRSRLDLQPFLFGKLIRRRGILSKKLCSREAILKDSLIKQFEALSVVSSHRSLSAQT